VGGCNFHAQAIRHIHQQLSTDLAQTLACSLILTRLDYCNSVLYGAPVSSIGSCSVCRTMQPESSSRHWGGPMPNRWCVNYTGCRFNSELTTRCLCWHTRLWTRLYHGTSANASTGASPHGHYTFARTDFAKRSFRCAAPSVWNSLPAFVIGNDSLSVFRSRLKTFLFRRSVNWHTQPTAASPVKSRPYGAS